MCKVPSFLSSFLHQADEQMKEIYNAMQAAFLGHCTGLHSGADAVCEPRRPRHDLDRACHMGWRPPGRLSHALLHITRRRVSGAVIGAKSLCCARAAAAQSAGQNMCAMFVVVMTCRSCQKRQVACADMLQVEAAKTLPP